MSFKRTNATVDTFGKTKRVARRLKGESSGRVAQRAGNHAGGPCPAVCLATLTGWHYQRAASFLARHTGFAGAGDHWEQYIPAVGIALGQTPEYAEPVGTVGTTVSRLFAGRSGAVRCRGHVMPVLNGRLLNAGRNHERMRCEGAVLFDIE